MKCQGGAAIADLVELGSIGGQAARNWKGKVMTHNMLSGSGHILWTTEVQYSQEGY